MVGLAVEDDVNDVEHSDENPSGESGRPLNPDDENNKDENTIVNESQEPVGQFTNVCDSLHGSEGDINVLKQDSDTEINSKDCDSESFKTWHAGLPSKEDTVQSIPGAEDEESDLNHLAAIKIRAQPAFITELSRFFSFS